MNVCALQSTAHVLGHVAERQLSEWPAFLAEMLLVQAQAVSNTWLSSTTLGKGKNKAVAGKLDAGSHVSVYESAVE